MTHAFSQVSVTILLYINGIHGLILSGYSDKMISEWTVPRSRTGYSGSNGRSAFPDVDTKSLAYGSRGGSLQLSYTRLTHMTLHSCRNAHNRRVDIEPGCCQTFSRTTIPLPYIP
jgi:hypothetical protein